MWASSAAWTRPDGAPWPDPCAVILPKGELIPGLNDSKKLTDKKRRELFPIIKEKAVAYGIAFATEAEIDEINILQATFLAMERALTPEEE